MIKLTDYISKRLVEYGVKDIFMISGGGVMHLVDSIGKQKELNYICPHHEQAAAIAAEGYSRVCGKLGVVVVTSGPGGTNTITGVIGQWLDSVPCFYLSGQVKRETTISSCSEIGLRQLGDQEINIVDIVRPVTKFAAIIDDPYKVRYYFEKSMYIATHGRPGPVWLDIPLDVQSAMIDENKLKKYDEEEDEIVFNKSETSSKISEVVELLKKSARPVIIAGNGIRIGGAKMHLLKLVEKLKIPILTSFNGFDLIETEHEYFVGRIGTIGTRAGNFALQNSDLVISVGTRNNIRQISYNWKTYAKNARKIIVDIDEKELKKPTIKADLPIHLDAKFFLIELLSQIEKVNFPSWKKWKDWCLKRKNKYPVVLDEYKNLSNLVQPYYFMNVLSILLEEGDVVVTGNGTASVCYFQAGIVKKNQRIIWNSGCASMGYDLPAAIGACFANNKKQVICIAGDGSLQMNIQELQTVFHHKLPIKLFVLNNEGYVSIRQTQDSFFEGRHVACSPMSGVSMPDIIKVASAYGLKTEVINNHAEMDKKITSVLNADLTVVCEVKLLTNYTFSPKLSSKKRADGSMISKPLEDMYPFLSREEFRSNILAPEYKFEEEY